MLGEISQRSFAERGVLVSAVVVTKPPDGAGMPGSGFFDLARQVGLYTNSGPEADALFWAAEVRRVFAAYR